uniref:Uncharacterized protein n=1 Tax=Oryza barthii TaxID=65489 RepID=A0A0D3FP22_9ORYZ
MDDEEDANPLPSSITAVAVALRALKPHLLVAGWEGRGPSELTTAEARERRELAMVELKLPATIADLRLDPGGAVEL